ncbi:FkbM family methyltransferase [Fibrella arboris]|uniref:FkbM family methyltransferase n=1 Tax=Fibrella arboris TaxID=3242486 RepID=UPI003522BA3C
MASRLKGLLKTFGWLDALRMYTAIKTHQNERLSSGRYSTTFHLRPHTSDLYTFDQVFIQDQYKLPYPFDPKTIVDAGANIGLSAVYFAHRFPDAQLVAIEPDKANFAQLQRNCANYPQIEARCAGVWSTDGYLKISNTEATSNSFQVVVTTPDDATALPAVCLPTLMQQRNWPIIDLLKIDIEGSEKELFSTNYDIWLPRVRMLLVEVHDQMQMGSSAAVFRATSQFNFSFDMKHENLIFINQDLL